MVPFHEDTITEEPPEWDAEDAGLDDLDDEYARDAGQPNELVKSFDFIRLSEFEPNLENPWIVRDLIPRQGFGVAFGAPGDGKTAIILDLVLHVAAGLEYRGRRVECQPVVYVCLEGHGGIENRVVVARDNLELQDAPFALVKASANFRDRDAALRTAAVAKELLASGVGDNPVVVVDTFQAALGPGGSDCLPEHVGAFIECVKEHLVGQSMTVIAIHHTGKDASRGARGWSGLNAAVDFELEIGRNPDGLRTLGVSKMRDGADAQGAFCYRLRARELGEDPHGELVTAVIVDHLADAGKGKSRKISGKARAALEKLWEMIKDSSQSHPLHGGPLRCVLAGAWLAACAEPGVASKGKEPRNRRVKARAAIKELVEAEIVIVEGNLTVQDLHKARAYPTKGLGSERTLGKAGGHPRTPQRV